MLNKTDVELKEYFQRINTVTIKSNRSQVASLLNKIYCYVENHYLKTSQIQVFVGLLATSLRKEQ